MINNASVLDTRKLMTGKDGRLFIEIDGESTFLAEVDSFTVTMSVTNVDAQPVGSILVYGVNSGVSYAIQLSEMVVRDDLILKPLLDKIAEGKMPTYNFQAGSERWDGQEQRITLRNCTPDGEFSLVNLVPGEIIKRTQNFRINSHPEWLSALTYA
jgi:hypothetical protein